MPKHTHRAHTRSHGLSDTQSLTEPHMDRTGCAQGVPEEPKGDPCSAQRPLACVQASPWGRNCILGMGGPWLCTETHTQKGTHQCWG